MPSGLAKQASSVRVAVGPSEIHSEVIESSYGGDRMVSRHEFPGARPPLEAIDLDARRHLSKWYSIYVADENSAFLCDRFTYFFYHRNDKGLHCTQHVKRET